MIGKTICGPRGGSKTGRPEFRADGGSIGLAASGPIWPKSPACGTRPGRRNALSGRSISMAATVEEACADAGRDRLLPFGRASDRDGP